MCININYVYTDSMHLVSASNISLEKTQNTYENFRKKYFIFFLVGDLQVVSQSLTPGVSLNEDSINRMYARDQMVPLLEHSIDRIYSTYPNQSRRRIPQDCKRQKELAKVQNCYV